MKKFINRLDDVTSCEIAKELSSTKIIEEKCILSFDRNITYTPFGMLLIGNTIKKLRSQYLDKKFIINVDKLANSVQYAGHMGFFKYISEDINFGKCPGEAEGSNSYIAIEKVDFVNYRKGSYQWFSPLTYIQFEAKRLSRVLSNGDKNLEELLTFLITEIIRNSQEHGNTECSWICAQSWKTKGRAEIAILDNGMGYKESLRKKYGEEIKADKEAIEYALRPGISESYIKPNPDQEDNTGFGLYMISEVCNELRGKFVVATGNCALVKSQGTRIIKDTFVEGTIIKIEIDTTVKFVKDDLLNKISMKGEMIKENYKKTSELTKGKILMKM